MEEKNDVTTKIEALKLAAVPRAVSGPRDRLCAALLSGVRLHVEMRRRVYEIEARAGVGLRPTLKRIADEVPQNAGLFGAGRDHVIKIAQDKAMNAERSKYAREVAEKSTEAVTKIGEEARAAFQALDLALEAEKQKWHGPSTLRDDAPHTMEQHLAEQRLAYELESGGVEFVRETYEGALRVGDADRAQKIEAAARGFLLRIVSGGARDEERRKSARAGGRTTDGAALGTAVALLHRFEQERLARIPADLTNAFAVREALAAVYAEVLGVHARFMSSAEFQSSYLHGDGSALRDPYRVDPKWPIRYAPPNAPLPDWNTYAARGHRLPARITR